MASDVSCFRWSECYFLSSSYLVVWDPSISHKLDIDTWDYFQCSVFKVPYNLLRKLLWEIASRFSAFPPECFAFLFWIETVLSRFRGDREIRTLDPLLARQVLSPFFLSGYSIACLWEFRKRICMVICRADSRRSYFVTVYTVLFRNRNEQSASPRRTARSWKPSTSRALPTKSRISGS